MAQKPLRLDWRPNYAINLILIGYIVLGLLLVTHYGISLDEEIRYNYAASSLKAYQTGETAGLGDEKGPFYGMVALLGGNLLAQVFTGWSFIDRWHYMTYLSFVMGVFFFYRLCRRLIKPYPALVATLLFATQPIIWGHAFMNPKDIPFMAFFLGSVSLGLEMTDHLFPRKPDSASTVSWRMGPFHLRDRFARRFQQFTAVINLIALDWRTSSARSRKWLVGLASLAIGLIASYPLITTGIRWLVVQAYTAPPTSQLGSLFLRFAQHSAELPMALYVNKSEALYQKLIAFAEISLAIGIAAVALWAFSGLRRDLGKILKEQTWGRVRPVLGFPGWLTTTLHQISQDWGAASRNTRLGLVIQLLALVGLVGSFSKIYPLLKSPIPYFWLTLGLGIGLTVSAGWTAQKIFSRAVGRIDDFGLQFRLLAAGCFLGFASDIRTLGPASGLLVAVYCLVKAGRKSILFLLEYLGIGALTTYMFWPNLWNSPITNYLKSLSKAADFPWNNDVLFGGRIYTVQDLPSSYVPTIFGAQLTETALLMILIGLAIAAIHLWKRDGLGLDVLLLGTWSVAPIAAAILMHSPIYDNARQFFFVLPPLFVLAGLSLQYLWERIQRKLIFTLVALAILGLGIYWDIHLYPYEYIYYNSLVGGVQGAFRNYEIDYWGVSFKEDVEYLNKITPQIAYVKGPYLAGKIYNRPGLKVVTDTTGISGVEYVVILSKRNKDQTNYPESKIIFQVERDHTILSVIKQIKPGDPTGN